jgi:ABC-type cobalamin/Fe3+-siderophores transport system ATPase subunit
VLTGGGGGGDGGGGAGLRGVSFRVPAGSSLAIVGPTGSGKTTCARLLFRFFDAEGGAVRVGGRDVRELTQRSLRGALGVVPQVGGGEDVHNARRAAGGAMGLFRRRPSRRRVGTP